MSDADAIIAALRTGHEALATRAAALSDDELAGPSGASDWDVAQVLSHLGSGAEIGLVTLRAALGEGPALEREDMLAIWDRWNAMPRREQADSFVRANEDLTARYEALTGVERADLRIDLGFLPAPVDVATAAGMRLSELTLHAWDVAVAFDAHATLPLDATAELLPRSGLLFGWLAKPEPLDGRTVTLAVRTVAPTAELVAVLGEQPSLSNGAAERSDAVLDLPAEAWLRLTSGRLSAEHTPLGVVVTGAVDLDTLRRVFPGY